jgi:putative hemolysin
MNRIPPEEILAPRAMQMLPPLLKGYLRVGGFIGEGAVVDYDFGTTDVCVVVKTEWVTDRYYRHFLRDDAGKDAGVPYTKGR